MPFEFVAFAGSLGLFLSILKRLRSDEFGINSYLQECEFPPDLPTSNVTPFFFFFDSVIVTLFSR